MKNKTFINLKKLISYLVVITSSMVLANFIYVKNIEAGLGFAPDFGRPNCL